MTEIAPGYARGYVETLPTREITTLLTSTGEVMERMEFAEGMDPRVVLKELLKARERILVLLGENFVPAIDLSSDLDEDTAVMIHPFQRGLGGYPRFSTSGGTGGKTMPDGTQKGEGKVWIDSIDMIAAKEYNARKKGTGRGEDGRFRGDPSIEAGISLSNAHLTPVSTCLRGD